MKTAIDPLDTMKEIILLYANTPPEPIENLRLIEKAMLDPFYLDTTLQCQIWENIQSQTILSIRIETIIRLHALGLDGAKAIFNNQTSKDEFMTDIMGYNEPYPPEKERISAWFDSAFHEIYGYTVATYCPCSLAKMKILHEKGFVSGGEDLREARWEKDRLNCLSCDHLQFVAILEDLSKGSYDLLGKSEIVQKYHKTIIEEAEFCSGKHPLRVY